MVKIFQGGGRLLRLIRSHPDLDLQAGDFLSVDRFGHPRYVIRRLDDEGAGRVEARVWGADYVSVDMEEAGEPVGAASVAGPMVSIPDGEEPTPETPAPAAGVPDLLGELRARVGRALEDARHVFRVRQDDTEAGVLEGDLLYFDAEGRPLAVFRALVGHLADRYRLRYGRTIQRHMDARRRREEDGR